MLNNKSTSMRYYLNPQQSDDDYQPLRINTLKGAFYLLAVGLIASFIVFLAELWIYRMQSKRQPGLMRWDTRLDKWNRKNRHSRQQLLQQRERRRLERKREKQFQQMQRTITPKFKKSSLPNPFGVYLP